MRTALLLTAASALLLLARFMVPSRLDLSATAFVKDAAHLFVGGLAGAAVASRRARPLCLTLAGVLSAVELAAALFLR